MPGACCARPLASEAGREAHPHSFTFDRWSVQYPLLYIYICNNLLLFQGVSSNENDFGWVIIAHCLASPPSNDVQYYSFCQFEKCIPFLPSCWEIPLSRSICFQRQWFGVSRATRSWQKFLACGSTWQLAFWPLQWLQSRKWSHVKDQPCCGQWKTWHPCASKLARPFVPSWTVSSWRHWWALTPRHRPGPWLLLHATASHASRKNRTCAHAHTHTKTHSRGDMQKHANKANAWTAIHLHTHI